MSGKNTGSRDFLLEVRGRLFLVCYVRAMHTDTTLILIFKRYLVVCYIEYYSFNSIGTLM